MAYQNIKNYLREHPEECAEIFNFNERYIFFREWRTVRWAPCRSPLHPAAPLLPTRLFSKGGARFHEGTEPQLDPGESAGLVPFSRFVLNQDAGAAIKGPGRIDLFYGDGRRQSNWQEFEGKRILYFLVKKKVKSSPIGNGLTIVRNRYALHKYLIRRLFNG